MKDNPPVATLKIQVSESITGKFQSRIDVESDGWSIPWFGYTAGDDTPLEAMESAIKKMKYISSPSKRGRRETGWRSVLWLKRRRRDAV